MTYITQQLSFFFAPRRILAASAVIIISSAGWLPSMVSAQAVDPSPFALYATSTVYTVVDNPTQDLYNGVILFLGVFVLIIWLFRRKR